MNLIKWNPFPGFEELEERLNRLVRSPEMNLVNFGGWTPAVDIKETETEYLVTADLPEVKKEEVKVIFHDGVLTIEGERKLEREKKTERFHNIERGYGKFVRRFALPTEVDPTEVTAEFKEGVLNVRLPKSVNARPRAIEVRVA